MTTPKPDAVPTLTTAEVAQLVLALAALWQQIHTQVWRWPDATRAAVNKALNLTVMTVPDADGNADLTVKEFSIVADREEGER